MSDDSQVPRAVPTPAPPPAPDPASQHTRREFVIASIGAGAALVLGVRWTAKSARLAATPSHSDNRQGPPFEPHALIRIEPTGATTILVNKTEMGQGVWTSLPLIVAEELDADWSAVTIDRRHRARGTETPRRGAANSVDSSWLPLRRAGAVARAMLIAAAAGAGVSHQRRVQRKRVWCGM